MSTLGTNYGISELRIAYALEDAINFYLVDGTMPNEGTLYGISEKRLAIAIAENTSISGGSAAWGAITGNLASQSDLSTALSLKQNSLVSGTNIKTINSNSLLGGGDLSISTSPAGTTGQIQFNSAGSFGASSGLTWDGTNLKVLGKIGLNQSTPLAQLDIVNSSATQPSLKITGASGQSAVLQQWLTSEGTVVASVGANGNITITTQNTSAALTISQLGGAGFVIDSVSGQAITRFFSSREYWLQSNESPIQIRAGGNVNATFFHDGGMQVENVATNTSRPTVNIQTRGTQSASLFRATGSSTQTGNLIEAWSGTNNTLLTSVAKPDGSYGPASLTNASATNNSLYYSTTLSRLAYKASSGNIFAQNQRQYSTKTANYTLTIADDFVRFNGTSLTATLPDAATMSGHEFEIKNVNSSALTINTTSSQLMDSNLTVSLSKYEVLKVVSNGTNWDII